MAVSALVLCPDDSPLLLGSYGRALRSLGVRVTYWDFMRALNAHVRLGRIGSIFSSFVPVEPWITVVSGASGAGAGTVRLAVAGTTDTARSGTATIAGLTFTVNQASGCTYSVAPAAIPAAAVGGPATFNVTTSGPGCTWTVTTDVTWITITGAASGTGSGAVNFTVQANPGAARTGTINVQGQVVTVTQSGI